MQCSAAFLQVGYKAITISTIVDIYIFTYARGYKAITISTIVDPFL